jgi:hypothetical protein
MRFESNEERMKHPQARLIPDKLWNHKSAFNKELSDERLILMKTSEEELIGKLHKLVPGIAEKRDEEKQMIWPLNSTKPR